MLFFSNILGAFSCFNSCSKKNSKLTKLYKKAENRINKELDIVKILTNVRNLKILLKNSMIDEQVRFEIAHADKNLISLDTDEEIEMNMRENMETPDRD